MGWIGGTSRVFSVRLGVCYVMGRIWEGVVEDGGLRSRIVTLAIEEGVKKIDRGFSPVAGARCGVLVYGFLVSYLDMSSLRVARRRLMVTGS